MAIDSVSEGSADVGSLTEPVVLDDATAGKLASLQGWARFLGGGGFALSLIIVVSLAGILAVQKQLPSGARTVVNATFVASLIWIFGFAIVLWRFASDLADFRRGRTAALVAAFRNQRIFWILTVLGQALFLVVALVAIFTGADAAVPALPDSAPTPSAAP